MRKLTALAAFLVLGAPALAAEVAPGDVQFGDTGVEASLTGVPGDPAAGAKVFVSGRQGNCLACHANQKMSNELFHGNVGPALDGVADRYSMAELRAIVVDSKKALSPETVMPGFYSLEVGKNVAKDFVGKTVLTAQEVEDVLAYISTLKE